MPLSFDRGANLLTMLAPSTAGTRELDAVDQSEHIETVKRAKTQLLYYTKFSRHFHFANFSKSRNEGVAKKSVAKIC